MRHAMYHLQRFTPLLLIAAAALTLLVAAAVLSGRGLHLSERSDRLPAPVCPDRSADPSKTKSAKAQTFTVRHAAAGCNAASAAQRDAAQRALTGALTALRAQGLPSPTAPVAVRLVRGGDRALQVRGAAGQPGAIVLPVDTAAVGDLALRAVAQLVVLDAAPGVESWQTPRIAVAVAALASPSEQTAARMSKVVRAGQDPILTGAGVFDAWLISRAGTSARPDRLLRRCVKRCSWEAVLSDLAGGQRNLDRLVATFAERAATTDTHRAQLRAAL